MVTENAGDFERATANWTDQSIVTCLMRFVNCLKGSIHGSAFILRLNYFYRSFRIKCFICSRIIIRKVIKHLNKLIQKSIWARWVQIILKFLCSQNAVWMTPGAVQRGSLVCVGEVDVFADMVKLQVTNPTSISYFFPTNKMLVFLLGYRMLS